MCKLAAGTAKFLGATYEFVGGSVKILGRNTSYGVFVSRN